METNGRASNNNNIVASREVKKIVNTQEECLDQFGVWKTPQKVSDLTVQLAQLNINSTARRHRRTLFRKVERAFNRKEFEITTLQRKVDSLMAELDNKKGGRRKKVEMSPNSKFASIKEIKRAQRLAEPVTESSDESECSDSSEMIESCIEVGCK